MVLRVLLNIYLYLATDLLCRTEQDVIVWINYVNVWSKFICLDNTS